MQIQETLNSLISQDYPKESYEIIVVDNNSTDRTYNLLINYCKEYSGLIKVETEKKIQSSYAARNRGIEKALGNILCFLDSNMTVNPNYLTRLHELFSREQADYVGCKVKIYSDKNTLTAKHNKFNGFPVKLYLES